jgi:hypothetical protein
MRKQLVMVLMNTMLGFGGAAALAEQSVSTETPNSDADKPAAVGTESATNKAAIRRRVAEWLKTCLGDWDRATHMTKQEWRTTCERVASERGNYLLENPAAGTMLLEVTKNRTKR